MTVPQDIFEVIKQRKADYEAGQGAGEQLHSLSLRQGRRQDLQKGGRRGYRNSYRC